MCMPGGGYSIESALPYVNTGIILAMAGLDYSGVKEPDYNRIVCGKIRGLRSILRNFQLVAKMAKA